MDRPLQAGENPEMEGDLAGTFRSSGCVVLRRAFDPGPLAAEFDRAFAEGVGPTEPPRSVRVGSGGVRFRYLPMMCERTPVSLDLLDRLAPTAGRLLGRAVLPGRAKGTRYYGDTGWHRDSELALPSVALVAYLEPVRAATGALRVLPGSHADRSMPVPGETPVGGPGATAGEAIETDPGDVIAFDEHLIHGSAGGGERRQWRVDFFADPAGPSEEEEASAYLAQIFPTGRRERGYDPRLYPSYGRHWLSMGRPWTGRLGDLGAYERAWAMEGVPEGGSG